MKIFFGGGGFGKPEGKGRGAVKVKGGPGVAPSGSTG